MLAAVDWTMVLEALIYTLPAIIAAVFAGSIHHQIKTPSGKHIGAVAEYAHDTAIANNLLLSKENGQTKPADPGKLRAESENPPKVPAE